MTQIKKPSWELFERLVAEARDELLICAPWMSLVCLQRLERILLDTKPAKQLRRIQFWARVADANTDSQGILALIQRLELTGISAVLRDSPLLHAKIYVADQSLAIITSANFSQGGFSDNIEAAVFVDDSAAIAQLASLLAEIERKTVPVSIADLQYFVSNQRPPVVEMAPNPAGEVVPIWRRPKQTVVEKREPQITLNFTEFMSTVKASVAAFTAETWRNNLDEWIGRRVRICACPCAYFFGPSPYWSVRMHPFFTGELKLGQRLPSEWFTTFEGRIEQRLEKNRYLFWKKRAREARIKLTKYPDPGEDDPLRPTRVAPHFLLKVEEIPNAF